MNFFLGVDPGASGGIGWIWEGGSGVTSFKNLTEQEIMSAFRERRECFATYHWLATIERVHSMPKQGVSSSFKFGASYGFLRGILHSLMIPFEEVAPQTWQKSLGCLSGGVKAVTKSKAQQLFPTLKLTHSTADAILIAEYARRKHGAP